MSADKLSPLTETDTLIHHEEHDRELSRVVMVCLDPDSADTVFTWANDNFIIPSKDLVSVQGLAYAIKSVKNKL
jgi:hypothetical protein